MQPDPVTKAALVVTKWIGSPASIFIHTILFILCFIAVWLNMIGMNQMLLALTTIVSLEAIYLALFIQMTVNFQAESLAEVEKDIDEMQEDVDEIQEDIDELQEDVEEMTEDEEEDEKRKADQKQILSDIHANLTQLSKDIERLQSR